MQPIYLISLALASTSSMWSFWCHGCCFPYIGQSRLKELRTSMSEFQEFSHTTTSGAPRWVGLALGLLSGLSLIGLGLGWSALNQAKNLEQTTVASKQASEALGQRLAKEDEINQQLQSDQKVDTLATSMKAELATKASADDVTKLNGDVTGVKGDLDATKNSIQMARSEMGTLIARNHDEIDQLRRTGQRDYFEFTVQRKGGATKVGSIQLVLKDTNPRKNQYTINVLADDNSFEKKNRSVNEPIFFYTGSTRSALELVVNKVTKTSATGYLSLPKGATTASASTATSGQ